MSPARAGGRKARLDLEVQRVCPALPEDGALRRWVRAALQGRRRATALVIRLVDEAEMAQLNQTYRGKAGPTNVLSFPFAAPPPVQSDLIGDLVICAPLVAREAAQQGKPAVAHWAHLVVHGVLHLLGHDHLDAAAARAMEALETDILGKLGFPDPYDQTEES
jgi:probable rRNA maturation factor